MNDSMKGDLIFFCFMHVAVLLIHICTKISGEVGGDYRILRSAASHFMTLK